MPRGPVHWPIPPPAGGGAFMPENGGGGENCPGSAAPCVWGLGPGEDPCGAAWCGGGIAAKGI